MRFWKIFDKILDLMAGLAGVITVFICAAVCYSIFMRFFFTKSTIWLMQTTEYALLWIVFLATTWLLREGGHITTDIIYSHLGNKAKSRLSLITFIICGITCSLILYYSAFDMVKCFIHNVCDVRAVTVQKWYVFCIIPIGSMFLTVQFFRMAWGMLNAVKEAR